MSGDPSKVNIWADADVYVDLTAEAANPATIDDEFGVDWDLVGILDGDAGFVESRNEDVSPYYGWGVGLVRVSRAHFALMRKFTCLEYNDTVRGLVYPGSAAGEIRVPRVQRIKIAFETTDGELGIKRRLISAYQAECSTDGDLSELETDVSKFPFTTWLFPDTTTTPPRIFVEQITEAGS